MEKTSTIQAIETDCGLPVCHTVTVESEEGLTMTEMVCDRCDSTVRDGDCFCGWVGRASRARKVRS